MGLFESLEVAEGVLSERVTKACEGLEFLSQSGMDIDLSSALAQMNEEREALRTIRLYLNEKRGTTGQPS